MAAPPIFDPLQMWRDALTRIENQINTQVLGHSRSPELVRALHQLSSSTAAMQQMVDKSIGFYLRAANLPSRKEVLALAEALQRIEDKIDRLLPTESLAPQRRPPRTRRPPAAVEPVEPVEPLDAGSDTNAVVAETQREGPAQPMTGARATAVKRPSTASPRQRAIDAPRQGATTSRQSSAATPRRGRSAARKGN